MALHELTYAFDAYCGWCYGFGPAVHRFADEHGDRIRVRVLSGGLFIGERALPVGAFPHIAGANARIAVMTGVRFGEPYQRLLADGTTVMDSTMPAIGLIALRRQAPERALAFTAERRARLAAATGLGAKEVGWLARDPEVLAYFERVWAGGARDAKVAAAWVMGELQRALHERQLDSTANPVGPERLGELLDLVAAGTISATAAKDVLGELFTSADTPAAVVERLGLAQISDQAALEAVVAKVLGANPDLADKYRGGKHGVLGALVGQVMRETRGRANPKLASELLDRAIRA
jgi:hypothetical protein